MPRNRLAGLLLTALLLITSPSHAQTQPCKIPNQACLLLHLEQLINNLPTSEQRDQLLVQWRFERDKHYLKKTAPQSANPAIKTLLSEEAFIGNGLEQAVEKVTAAIAPESQFQDALAANPRLLLIQWLTLDLQDMAALELKRELLESHWSPTATPNSELMNIARHEILGGNPSNGLQTLSNIQVNEFSDLQLVNEVNALQVLGKEASDLFLNPTTAKRDCGTDTALLLSTVQRFYSLPHQQLLHTLWDTPDQPQAWRSHLSLMLLYKNAGTCSLFIELHKNTLIQSLINIETANENDVRDLIYLARALRRYLNK